MKSHNDNEKNVLVVVIFTLLMMFVEIGFGYFTNSMALLADGIHMGTHAFALGLTYISYVVIRKINIKKVSVSVERVDALFAYTSALLLLFTGIFVIKESVERFFSPKVIEFNEAIIVAIIGLIVNAICIFIMERKEGEHKHHDSHKEDYNFSAAYYHILADTLTSIFAIVALLIGKFYNIIYFDMLSGVLGGILIIKWSYSLIKKTCVKLIDIK